MSLYTVAGVSTNKGKVKVRFCSDLVLRIKNLQKQGDTNILLIELPQPMTKVDVCKYLAAKESFKEYRNDIEEVMLKKSSKTSTADVQPKIVIRETIVDSEIEDIKELVAA